MNDKKYNKIDKHISKILTVLEKTYPEAKCELNFTNPFQLLIATMLSAQSTDKKVNQVTEKLFQKYQTPSDFLKLTQEELENEIKQIGIYRNKAKNILATCHILIENYNSQVPNNIELLTTLPGVGRKTANVVVSVAFNIPAIAVDTHVFRVSNRLGLASSDKVEKVEEELMEVIPKEKWIDTHHWLIWHGRRVCKAQRPNCKECSLIKLCPSFIE